MDKRPLHVEMDDLLDAMDDHSSFHVPFFHRGTGKVALHFEDAGIEADPVVDPDDPDWVEVPRATAHDGIREIEHFIATLDELDVQRNLRQALQGKGAFRRFRDTLHGYPDLRARWQRAHHEHQLQRALDFLEQLGIAPIYELRYPVPGTTAAPAPPPPQRHPRVGLHHLLLLGSPTGRPELLDGCVHRCIRLRSPRQARTQFEQLAREIMELHGLAWRRSTVDGLDTIAIDPFRLELDGNTVRLATAVPGPVWDAFG